MSLDFIFRAKKDIREKGEVIRLKDKYAVIMKGCLSSSLRRQPSGDFY